MSSEYLPTPPVGHPCLEKVLYLGKPQDRMSCGAKILLKDRYRALKILGQGGFEKTFKAVDEDQPRKPLCVIKQFVFSNNHPETRQIALKLL